MNPHKIYPSDHPTGHGPQPKSEPRPGRFWTSKAGLVTIGFLLIGGFFLLTEHRAHALGALPFLLLAACPLLHMFMHGGHGGHGSHGRHTRQNEPKQGARGGSTPGNGA
jgi:hypothetical protein